MITTLKLLAVLFWSKTWFDLKLLFSFIFLWFDDVKFDLFCGSWKETSQNVDRSDVMITPVDIYLSASVILTDFKSFVILPGLRWPAVESVFSGVHPSAFSGLPG